MTLDELLSDEVFRKATRIHNFNRLFLTADRAFCHYAEHIFGTVEKRITISKHTQTEITIYDYTSLSQDEIHNLIDAKIKYDLNQYDYNKYSKINDYNKFSKIFSEIISENNEHIKKYDLSQITPDLLHEIINKNEVFIANLNSLYTSNKILAELDAL